MDVFGLFSGEGQKGPHAIIVALQLPACLIKYEGQNEFFDQPEGTQVIEAANLIQLQLFSGRQEAEFLHSCERLRHKRLSEVERFITADDVFEAPVRLLRSEQRFLVTITWYCTVVFLRHGHNRFLLLLDKIMVVTG